MRTAGGCHRDGASTLDVLIKRLQERQARVEALRAMLAALPASMSVGSAQGLERRIAKSSPTGAGC